MKKLLNIFAKLNKIPALVWILFVGASYVFASYYNLRFGYNELLEGMFDAVASAGLQTDILSYMTQPGVIVAYLIMSGLIGIIIFEIILHLVFRSLFIRRHSSSDDKSFKSAARAVYTAANIFIGLYSLLYFPLPSLFIFGVSLIDFAVYTAAFTLGYVIVSYTVIYPQFVADAFKRLYTLYFAINGIFAALNLVTTVRGESSVPEIIASALSVAVVAGAAVIIHYTVYKKLLERQKSYIAPPPSDNDEIYKGFGF